MWTDLIQMVDFIGFALLLAWGITGAYLWQRYGSDGAYFVWSKDFPQALHDWQAKMFEAKKQEALETIKAAEAEASVVRKPWKYPWSRSAE